MTNTIQRVGAVILTYNSVEDLPHCLSGLVAQHGIDLRMIVVDNASRADARAEMERNFRARLPSGVVIDANDATTCHLDMAKAIFVRNDRNVGYSAGNNIGARLAAHLGCDAVLIINPDVRIDNPNYVAELAAVLAALPGAGLAASTVRSLSGSNENPMFEPNFFEEFLWPISMLLVGLKLQSKVKNRPPELNARVEKVSGSCFLILTKTLEKIGYFDENVFLYSEESILRATLKRQNISIAYNEILEVLHAHDVTRKENSVRRYTAWSQSRAYYHYAYTNYGPIERALLAGSRKLTLGLVHAKAGLQRLRQVLSSFKKGRT